MANDRVKYAKALRKAIQLGLSAVELDEEDIAEISPLIDQWEPGAKYKKDMTVMDGSDVYSCIKNVNKSDVRPAEDVDHWVKVGGSSEQEPEEPDTPEEPESDGIPVWEKPADSKSGYRKGDRVHYPDASGPVYTSDANKNTDVPGESGAWILEPSDEGSAEA